MSYVRACVSLRLYHRCHPELRDAALHEGARDRIQHLHPGGVLVQDGEEDRHFHRLPHRGFDSFHNLLAAFPERVESPDLQDQVDANDYPSGGVDQDQECGQGPSVSELHNNILEEKPEQLLFFLQLIQKACLGQVRELLLS